MSQEKVNKYKEQKANRKEIIKKEKRHNMMIKAGAAVIGLVAVCWVGISIPQAYQDMQPREEYAIDYTAVDTYFESIS
ncbi:MAG: hypothetical protein R3Y40_00670 [Eubacteriales bacterium]